MATKKQKRAAALAKREEFLKKERDAGLEAQARDRAQREIDAMCIKEWADGYNEHVREVLARHGINEGS